MHLRLWFVGLDMWKGFSHIYTTGGVYDLDAPAINKVSLDLDWNHAPLTSFVWVQQIDLEGWCLVRATS